MHSHTHKNPMAYPGIFLTWGSRILSGMGGGGVFRDPSHLLLAGEAGRESLECSLPALLRCQKQHSGSFTLGSRGKWWGRGRGFSKWDSGCCWWDLDLKSPTVETSMLESLRRFVYSHFLHNWPIVKNSPISPYLSPTWEQLIQEWLIYIPVEEMGIGPRQNSLTCCAPVQPSTWAQAWCRLGHGTTAQLPAEGLACRMDSCEAEAKESCFLSKPLMKILFWDSHLQSTDQLCSSVTSV